MKNLFIALMAVVWSFKQFKQPEEVTNFLNSIAAVRDYKPIVTVMNKGPRSSDGQTYTVFYPEWK